MKILLAALLVLILASCGGGGPSPPPPPPPVVVTIPDPMTYLAQSRATNGDVTTPLHDSDQMIYQRFDFGHYQAEASFLAADGSAITTWSYPPFGPFVAANGDGGEQYILSGDTVKIIATQDGSKPGVQTFPGPDNWLVFKTDATSTPKCVVAQLGSAQAYTCYSLQTINFPGVGQVQSIVSDHYNTGDPAKATAVERIILGHGWGRLAWQAWNSMPLPFRPSDLAARCPAFGIENPPIDGWTLNDCRYVVNISPADGTLTGSQLWHP